jgi:1-acyl-sn-glycerol-3-phosphate acyltransferase
LDFDRSFPRERPVQAMEAGGLSVLNAFSGKRVLMTGATGFIGKVTLAMLLDRSPDVGCVYILMRGRAGQSAVDRFFEMVAASPAFDPLRERHGDGLNKILAEKIVVLTGDVTLHGWGISGSDLGRLEGIDVIVNIAGLVSFNPSLDESIASNTEGARNGAELAARLKAKLVHVSTSYVAGIRTGIVSEREPIVGSYPRGGRSRERFDACAELEAAKRFVAQTRAAAERSGGSARRRARRRAEDEIVKYGQERAGYWGWPNIYCLTKSMGEQLIASTPGLDYTIVRPSIVESALSFPFPGWNEGMTTSAPVILAMCTGHVFWPIHRKAALDLVPVDYVAAGLLLATGATLLDAHERVYHLSSSDLNPLTVRRCLRYIGEYRSRYYRDHAAGPAWLHWLRTRLKIRAVPGFVYRAIGVPGYRRAVELLMRALEKAGLHRAPHALKLLERELAQVERVVEAFYPFIHDIDCVFLTDHIRSFYGRIPLVERARMPWNPERIDWRSYWFDVHIAGLRKWVFPGQRVKINPARVLPGAVKRAVRRVLAVFQRLLYARVFRTRVRGFEHVPADGGLLIVANHASHLDMGLVKHALGLREVFALAAEDYFFRDPLRRFYFSNFTNLIPFSRKTRLKHSLQTAGRHLAEGRAVLIFPEGTRTSDGRMSSFKPSLGYLALNHEADILPVFVHGTFASLPKGALLPRRRELAVSIGSPISWAELKRRTRGMPKKESYGVAAAIIEAAVRDLGGLHAAKMPSGSASGRLQVSGGVDRFRLNPAP